MSNNINTVQVLTLEASMRAGDIAYFCDEHEDDLCEDAFLPYLIGEARAALRTTGPDTIIRLDNFNWHGTGSGNSFEFLVKKICPKIHGHVKTVFIYESGHMTGLNIINGEVVEYDVEPKLVPKKTK